MKKILLNYLPIKIYKKINIYCNKNLQPRNDIKRIKHQSYQWQSQSNDPQFLIKKMLPKSGWNILELTLNHDQDLAVFSIYYNTGSGFNEDQCIFLSLKQNETQVRIIHLPKRIKSLRIDPLESKGSFSIIHFRITWLTHNLDPNTFIKPPVKRSKESNHKPDQSIKLIEQVAQRVNQSTQELIPSLFSEMHHKQEARAVHYNDWIIRKEIPYLTSNEFIEGITQHKLAPMFSIILPVYNTNFHYLKECIESVINQSYPNWELCIADDASTNLNIKSGLLDYHRTYALMDGKNFGNNDSI